MHDIKIVPYSPEYSEAAVRVEEQCAQGEALVLKYKRPTFHARSEVYEKYTILCAKKDDKIIGTVAWAEKDVKLHGEDIHAAYLYDLRVSPEYRSMGTNQRLLDSMMENVSQFDCRYYYMTGENTRAMIRLGMSKCHMKHKIPLTYMVLPVYKKFKTRLIYNYTSAAEVHSKFIASQKHPELLPAFDTSRLLGYKFSLMAENCLTGCSIWTNENIMAEQVVSVPSDYRMIEKLSLPLKPFIKTPYIPKPDETIRSWFIFDLFANDMGDTESFIKTVNNIAYDNGRQYIYILLQNDNPVLSRIKKSWFGIYSFSYFFVVGGNRLPAPTDNIYVDIRDL